MPRAPEPGHSTWSTGSPSRGQPQAALAHQQGLAPAQHQPLGLTGRQGGAHAGLPPPRRLRQQEGKPAWPQNRTHPQCQGGQPAQVGHELRHEGRGEVRDEGGTWGASSAKGQASQGRSRLRTWAATAGRRSLPHRRPGAQAVPVVCIAICAGQATTIPYRMSRMTLTQYTGRGPRHPLPCASPTPWRGRSAPARSRAASASPRCATWRTSTASRNPPSCRPTARSKTPA